MAKDEKKWELKGSKVVLDHPHLKVRADHVKLPSGLEVSDYTVWESGNVTQVVPVTKSGKYVFAKHYKHGLGKYILEFPGGLVEEGEDLLKAAERELLEETNYGFTSKPRVLGTFIHHPSKESGVVTIYYAKDVEIKEHDYHLDEAEDIEVVLLTKEEVQKYIDTADEVQTGTMVGFLMTKGLV